MCVYRSLVCALLICSAAALVSAQGSKNGTRTSQWLTLGGDEPLVVARGGFSGLFADSSSVAYQLAALVSLPNVIFWCDVQLTKDGVGICSPDLRLDNNTNVASIFKNKMNTYTVNGVSTQGWFTNDLTLDDLANVYLIQGIYSRPNLFDGNAFQILTVDIVAKQLNAPGLWLNIQHDAFFTQRNLSMRSFVISTFKTAIVDYVSSPEVNFLRSIVARKPSTTKLVFRFLGPDEVEPALNQTYSSLLSNLTFIKTFASGILVPKTYIWPVDSDLYLKPHTSLVVDAHKAGLEVFGADFANDFSFAYDYSYNPVEEYLSFVDNGNFSVDGVVSDFPITPSEAIGCFSHIGKNATEQNLLVISSEGSSGDYPGCTNLAYEKAISTGVDVLDCPVQMTKDGIPICLGSINLADRTNALLTPFTNMSQTISDLGIENGIMTFSLSWSEIQSLKPAITNPYTRFELARNPRFSNAGSLMTLSQFLDLANNATSVSGILIGIEDAAYLAEKQGLGVVDAVLDTLENFTSGKKVMIQSTNSSVLVKFKQESKYDLVYKVDENIRDADNATITDIKSFASSVVISKSSVFPVNNLYLTVMTDIVKKLHAFKLPVYAQLFRNEFVSQAWDFFSDINEEINTFFQSAEIDGVVSEFPGTAAKFKKNKCLGLGTKTPQYASPVQPGGLLQLITPAFLPPAQAPNPVLTEDDVAEPPLPDVVVKPNDNGTAPSSPPNGQPRLSSHTVAPLLALLIATLALM